MPEQRKANEDSGNPERPVIKMAGSRGKGAPKARTSGPATAKPRAKTTTASGKSGGQRTGRPRTNGSGGHATTRPPTREPHRNEKTPVSELAAKTSRDYEEAKKALGALWQDAATATHSAFTNLAMTAEKRYEEARKTIRKVDVGYALEKTQQKLKQVGRSTTSTAQTLAKQVTLLYQMLKDTTAGRFKAPWPTVSAITAALLYFISPIDLVPDFIPGLGLIDDALVIALCISVIRMDLRRYAKEMNLDLATYGLKK